MPARRCIDCRTRYTPGDPQRCPLCALTVTRAKNAAHAAQRNAAPGDGAARRARAAVNRAGSAYCYGCHRWHLAAAIEIDHIVALGDGGTDTDSNVQPLCKPCHWAKTTAENRARAARG